MRTLKPLTFLLFITLFVSCDEDDPIVLDPVESETVANLYAPQVGGQGGPGGSTPISGPFTLFDFETGAETTDMDAWDIGFRGTAIIVNGGVSSGTIDEPERTGNAATYIATGGLAAVTEVDETLFVQDVANGFAIPASDGQGWYNYSGFTSSDPGQNNLITPITGVVLVFRTTEGRFAKVEIKSYYQDAPEEEDLDSRIHTPRYYTFNYVYQPNESVVIFDN